MTQSPKTPEDIQSALAGQKTNDIVITYVPIASLHASENHPRRHSKKNVAKAKSFLAAYGEVVPIVVDQSGEIIDGVLRHRALGDLGYEQVRVAIVPSRDPAALKALRLALNRLAQDATWDKDRLRLELSAVLEFGYEVETTGFEQAEIDMLFTIDDTAIAAPAKKVATSTPTDPCVVGPGDHWQRGRHDATCDTAVDPSLDLFEKGRIKAAIIKFEPSSTEPKPTDADPAIGADFEANLAAVIATAPDAVIYCFVDWRHIGRVLQTASDQGRTYADLCVFVRATDAVDGLYPGAHELCVVLTSGSAEATRFQSRSNVWSYEPDGVDRQAGAGAKPLALFSDIIEDVTDRGDAIIAIGDDLPSIVTAAEATGRVVVGVDRASETVQSAIQRCHDRNGKAATDIVTGDTVVGPLAGQIMPIEPGNDFGPSRLTRAREGQSHE